jgi:hypothetical protein
MVVQNKIMPVHKKKGAGEKKYWGGAGSEKKRRLLGKKRSFSFDRLTQETLTLVFYLYST